METTTTYQNGNNEAIKAVLYAMELTGFNPKNIDDNGIKLIINTIRRSFPRTTLSEFREAFEIGITGELDVNLQTYQSFNSLYVSNVLQSYSRYKMKQKSKPKVFEIEAPKQSTEYEKKRAFDIIKDEIFLKEDDRNGKRGEFPDLTLASWKDAYNYMIENGMLKELTGEALKEKIKAAVIQFRSEETNPKKRIANALNKKAINCDEKTMFFYRLEVMEWFNNNVNQLV